MALFSTSFFYLDVESIRVRLAGVVRPKIIMYYYTWYIPTMTYITSRDKCSLSMTSTPLPCLYKNLLEGHFAVHGIHGFIY